MAYERTIFENDTTVDAAAVLNKLDKAIYELSKASNGDVVWENSSTTTAMDAKTVNIAKDSEREATYYEIHFMRAAAAQYLMTTGKIPIANNTELTATGGGTARYRNVTVSHTTSNYSFAFATGYNGTTANTSQCIPVRILFYYA